MLGLSTNEPTLIAVKAMPLWFRVLLILRAAVFEEIFYRGFMIERLAELTRPRCPIMMSRPPRMVIQQSMARISFLYHASAVTPRAYHGDSFNTHA